MSLNIGVSGLVTDSMSVQYLEANNKVGDIISLEVSEDYVLLGTDVEGRPPLVALVVPN